MAGMVTVGIMLVRAVGIIIVVSLYLLCALSFVRSSGFLSQAVTILAALCALVGLRGWDLRGSIPDEWSCGFSAERGGVLWARRP